MARHTSLRKEFLRIGRIVNNADRAGYPHTVEGIQAYIDDQRKRRERLEGGSTYDLLDDLDAAD